MLDSLLTEEGLQYRLEQQRAREELRSARQIRPQLQRGRGSLFPKRPFINILLIILTTLEVVLIINSKVYLHSNLVRSFLSIYADADDYPELFEGNAFYLRIQNVTELQESMQYVLQMINSAPREVFLNLNYSKANITLQVQYHPDLDIDRQCIFNIDPQEGITDPFDLSNITSMQMFLLDVHYFEIVISNLEIQTQGLFERYVHRLIYHYDDGNEINIAFQFEIDNALVSNIEVERPQANFLLFLRVFYLIIMVLGLISLYLNTIYVRRAFKEFYHALEKKAKKKEMFTSRKSIFDELPKEDVQEIDENIIKNIETRDITIDTLRWEDYVQIIEFDVLFSGMANILQIISNVYLLFGREHETVVGLGCLFSWMTIFRVLRKYKRLILMYQLLKISMIRVMQFIVSFFIIFLGYTFMGMCFFPKVSFFCSMSNTVTTLASMMAGDSIDMITQSICEKNSTTLAIVYIFSYIILFMHAIHNTLTSLIKEYFILKKLQLIEDEKQKKGENAFIYLQEVELQSEEQKKKLPLKLTYSLEKDLIKIKREKKFDGYNKRIRRMFALLENLESKEQWDVHDHNLEESAFYIEYSKQKYLKIRNILEVVSKQERSRTVVLNKASQLTNQQDQI